MVGSFDSGWALGGDRGRRRTADERDDLRHLVGASEEDARELDVQRLGCPLVQNQFEL